MNSSSRQERFDATKMRAALALARRGYGTTSPNPMVGAVLVKNGKMIGRGWHRQAGKPHAEIEALRDAQQHRRNPAGATLYVTLEPCCTHGRTPPCTDAIIAAKISRAVIGTIDPNPRHAGAALKILKKAGIDAVTIPHGPLADECARLNEAFNHWIVHGTPFVTVKAAMSLDGRIATVSGESKWITGEAARAIGMKLRRGADAILVGVNTIIADNPRLTSRLADEKSTAATRHTLRRIILDSMARTPLNSHVVKDAFATSTTIVVSPRAPKNRVRALATRVTVAIAPAAQSEIGNRKSAIPPAWLLHKLGRENVTSLLVEGGGEVNASFLLGGFAQRVAFFYAPKVLGGRDARKAVAGDGVKNLAAALKLRDVDWKRCGEDLFLSARVVTR